MTKNIPKTGKKLRPKTAVKGKRFLCAKCRKRSPTPVKTPAPWYCPACLKEIEDRTAGGSDPLINANWISVNSRSFMDVSQLE
jgi:hypothetical protein